VLGTRADAVTTIDGGGDTDAYTINPGSLAGLLNIADSGTAGVDTLLANGTPEGDTIKKLGWQILFGDPPTEIVDFSGIEGVTIDAGAGNDVIVDPGEDTILLGGPGDDTIIVDATTGSGVLMDGGDGSDRYLVLLGNLGGPVTVADSGSTGSDALTVQGTPGADAMTLTGDQVRNGSESVIIASAMATLTIEGGGGADTTTIDGFIAPTTNLTVEGSGGTNTVTIVGEPPPGVNVEIVDAVQSVSIDARPKSEKEPDKINLGNRELIPVVIHTTASFNAALVDIATVRLAGARAIHHKLKDVDDDGDLDLVLRFRTEDTDLFAFYAQLLAEADDVVDGRLDSDVDEHQVATVALTGETLDGLAFEGLDELDLFLNGSELRKLIKDLARSRLI
jgi:hypothetical protein